ncbi:hypothetical protein BDW74DRAFT_116175 [Aspergillus multicolor]|uniref:uncharacterized protein n=1 Tax=Aspergillus multicolor TaxID=41759 RepID=UPI003CCE02E8
MLPVNASARPQGSSNQSYDNTANQLLDGFGSQEGQPSINTADMVNADNMTQPRLPAHNFTPSNDQTQENSENMVVDDMLQPIPSMQDCGFTYQQTSPNTNIVNVDDMIEPILPAQGFAPFNNRIQENAGTMVVDDMLLPVLSAQDCGFTYQQTSNDVNMAAECFTVMNDQVGENTGSMVVDDMLQPILSAPVCNPFESQCQTSMADIVGIRNIGQPSLQGFNPPNTLGNVMEPAVPHMFQATTRVRAFRPVDKQAPMAHGPWPTTTASLSTHNQYPFYDRQPVSAV